MIEKLLHFTFLEDRVSLNWAVQEEDTSRRVQNCICEDRGDLDLKVLTGLYSNKKNLENHQLSLSFQCPQILINNHEATGSLVITIPLYFTYYTII